ncbi:MAG: ABC transporter ATP-binding protein, partial [Butyricicoccus sp.]
MHKKPEKMPEGPMPGGKPQQFDSKTLGRVFSYMKEYRGRMVFVVLCILLSSIASAASSLFLQTLIDDYITPMLAMDTPVFTGLIHALITIGCIYLVGIIATLLYNRLMVTIAQGTLKKIRDEMFAKMQWLPIRYFDTHTHGEIMSLYTNDTDTLRQLIAQSMAQLVSSVFTIAAVFVCMLYISIPLSIVAVIAVILGLKIAGGTIGKVGIYFMRQQETLADLNGFVEEMVNGQRVIKVFCHEEKAKQQLRSKNKAWEEAASNANGIANSIMPMLCGINYLQYVVVAI